MKASNFNKTLVEKRSYLNKSIEAVIRRTFNNNTNLRKSYTIITDSIVYMGKTILPCDYTKIALGYRLIHNDDYEMYFDYDDVYKHYQFNDKQIEYFNKLYTEKSLILLGKTKDPKVWLLMDYKTNLVYEYNVAEQKVIGKNTILHYVFPTIEYSKLPLPCDYCHLKILDKNIPIIAILGYRFGLLKILKEVGVKYRLYTFGKRVPLNPDDIVIKFKDFTLVFNRYPLKHSLLLNGLSVFNTRDLTFASMDQADTYYKLFTDKGIKANYLKGINSFFNFFIDPITFDVLKQMNEPVTPKGLLLRSIEMLSTSQYTEASQLKNFRVRSNEKIAAVVYNEISRQYSQYLNDKRRDSSFSINTEAVFQRIVQDNAVMLHEDINPMQDIKMKTSATHLGFGGRSEDAFVDADRKYPIDAVGIISEATPDSGKVGMNFTLTPNAKIANVRGMFDTSINENDLDASSILSVTGLVMPGTVNND
jgi:hypothetical protein